MSPSDQLSTLAEIAITLAGFSGLIAAFRSREAWDATEKVRLLNILVLCFAVVLCATLPTFLANYFEDAELPWRISCFVYGSVQLVIVIRFFSGLFYHSWKPVALWLSGPIGLFALVVAVVSLGSALGVGPRATPSLLGLILIWGIVAAGFQFIFSLQSVWGVKGDDA
jgi:hypothetical protein